MTISFWQKNGAKIIIVFLIITGLVASWLMYQRYLRPQYELTQLLPKNYQISFEYKSDRFSFPKLQQEKILGNPALAGIYSGISKDLYYEFNKLNKEAQEILNQSKHTIFFYQDPEKYGLILKIPNKKTVEKIKQINFAGFNKRIVKEQILALANDQELLNQMVSQKISATSIPYLSLTISPWLKISFQNSFLNSSYPNQTLSQFQKTLQPLQFATPADYLMEIDSDAYSITLALKPAEPFSYENKTNLWHYFDFFQTNPDLVIGLTDLEDLKFQLENNENLKNLWQKFDSHLWISRQLSLSNLLKQLVPPVVFSLKGDKWQILTVKENKIVLEYYLKSYLAQFRPKESLKILPDGTRTTEFIADFSKINWQESQVGSWQTFQYDNSGNKNGLAEKDDLVIFSNKIDQLGFDKLSLSCSIIDKNGAKLPLETVFSLKSVVSWLNISEELINFDEMTIISAPDGQIRTCLEF